jgi:hypothetical protein
MRHSPDTRRQLRDHAEARQWWLRPVISAARVGSERGGVELRAQPRLRNPVQRRRRDDTQTPLTPYPRSSVMMSSTLGAPLGGTMRGGHQGLESLTLPDHAANAGAVAAVGSR